MLGEETPAQGLLGLCRHSVLQQLGDQLLLLLGLF
jgi:hypothetical protein